ncbi:MAG: hypothetical protein KDH09_05745 [Chrysiogenetes bacterium]|nr:hypothetical protein [Chrysiogenetes bacterium]
MAYFSRHLIHKGHLTQQQLAEAIEHQVVYGGRLGTNLIELGFSTEAQVADALAAQYGISTMDVDEDALQLGLLDEIGRTRCEQFKVFPHSASSKTLHLLMVDPSDHVAKAEISYATPYIVRPYVIPEIRMLALLQKYCDVSPEWRYEDSSRNYIALASRFRSRRNAELKPRTAPSSEPLTMVEALKKLQTATTRDEVVNITLRLAASICKRAIFYIVRKNYVLGWDCAGAGLEQKLIRTQIYPLNAPSVFSTVHDHPGPFVGKLPRTEANDLLRKSVVKRRGNSMVLPVVLADRVVNLIYCDNGPEEDLGTQASDLAHFTNSIAGAYERIIRTRLEEDPGSIG